MIQPIRSFYSVDSPSVAWRIEALTEFRKFVAGKPANEAFAYYDIFRCPLARWAQSKGYESFLDFVGEAGARYINIIISGDTVSTITKAHKFGDLLVRIDKELEQLRCRPDHASAERTT